MKIALPTEIRHNQKGFEALVCLCAQTKNCSFDDIDMDMSTTTWFDADMSAAFGAILYRLSENLNMVKLINIKPSVADILSKNGLLSNYGREKIPDHWGTTVPYQHFDVKDDRHFVGYIESELMSHSEIPSMSSGLRKKFRESIYEIFSNAVIHSQTKEGIFSCGQLFPKKRSLAFSIADLGIGIYWNVRENEKLDLTPEDAIKWATEERNTTKRGRISGGLGLKLLREFIDLNGGRIQIVSDAGYWSRAGKKTVTSRLSEPFPGTVVSVEINTADGQSYALSHEISETDIF
jgi:hypothetical protein